jgi:hypothetical protein
MNNISLSTLSKSISTFLHRFHLIIFVVIVVGGLAIAIMSVSSVLQESTLNDIGQSPDSQFDTATIKRINQLRTLNDSNSLTLPGGRTNPFVE